MVVTSLAIVKRFSSTSGASFGTKLAFLSRGVFVLTSRTVLNADVATQVDIEAIDEEATCTVLSCS